MGFKNIDTNSQCTKINRINFLCLSASFHFDDLRMINVSECNLITNIGFHALAFQNRHIEKIIANSCTGLNDAGKDIRKIVSHSNGK